MARPRVPHARYMMSTCPEPRGMALRPRKSMLGERLAGLLWHKLCLARSPQRELIATGKRRGRVICEASGAPCEIYDGFMSGAARDGATTTKIDT